MYAETEDGFVVSLIVADKGQVHFDVNSPCVGYSEVADPTRQATAPLDPEAEVIPRPNIHSEFWSAETPEVGVTPGR